jgi:predicted RNase H-like HicB family nuclease
MVHNVKIVIEHHGDGFVAHPLGIEGVVIGEGDTCDEALADVTSALDAYVEAFGASGLEDADDVLEVFVRETTVGA